MTWRFVLKIKDVECFSEAQANAVYSRCPDASLFSSQRRASIGFDRNADTLQLAIASAIADVRLSGLDVAGVEIEEGDIAATELLQWP